MHTEMVSFASGSRQLAGYMAKPEGDGPFPGVLVIHEIFGLNENIKEIARRFAEQGYVALAVDLFAGRSRMLCMFSLFAGMLTDSLHHAGIRDLQAALSNLAHIPGVDTVRIGAVGYCMGGSLAIGLACTDNRVRVVAPYYAMNPRPMAAVADICPVIGSYPAQDFTAKAGQRLDEALNQYRVKHDIKIYPGAKHSFFNETLPQTFDSGAADDSWQRVLAFFQENL
jgi:carboxymethylenebutenolidase